MINSRWIRVQNMIVQATAAVAAAIKPENVRACVCAADVSGCAATRLCACTIFDHTEN